MRLLWAIIGYVVVVIGAASTGILLIMFLDRPTYPTEVVNPSYDVAKLRAACDRQFETAFVQENKLDALTEVEYTAYFAADGARRYSSKLPIRPGTSGRPIDRKKGAPGYVMIRARPPYGGIDGYDATNLPLSMGLTVVQHDGPTKLAIVCGTRVAYRKGALEAYCEFPVEFVTAPERSYRLYLTNLHNVHFEYCALSNCDISEPFGEGSLCESELPLIEAPASKTRGWARSVSGRVWR